MGLKNLYHKLGKKAVTYGLAGSLLLGSGLGLSRCGNNVDAQSNPAIEQTYNGPKPVYRSPGKPKVDGTTYSFSDSFSGTYVDNQGIQHFEEEKSIGKIYNDEEKLNFNVADRAFDYANSHNCEIGAALIDHINKNQETFYTSSVENKNASIDLPKTIQGDLYAGVYCTNKFSGNTEFLASYPVSMSNRSTQVPSGQNVSRAGAPITPPYTPSIPSNSGSEPTGQNLSDNNFSIPFEHSTERKPSKRTPIIGSGIPTYEELDENKEPKYHLRTDCGKPNTVKSLVTNSELAADKYGKVTINEPKSCSIYLDENDNGFNKYSIEPSAIRDQVLSTTSPDNKKLTLDFRGKGLYSVIASTEKYPDEKDILIFEVREKVSSADAKTLEDLFKRVPVGSDTINAYIGQRKFLATKRKNVAESPLYKKQKSLNDILKENEGRIVPIDYVHQGNSLEFLLKQEEGLTYHPELWQIKQVAYTNGTFGYVIEKKVNLKQSRLNSHKLKIDKKGKLIAQEGNLQNKIVEFSYNEVRAGPSDGLSGNSYLFTLTGYDKNGNVKDLDAIIIEVVANLKKEFAKGLILGAVIGGSGGYYIGIADAASAGGFFTVKHSSDAVKAAVAGAKTGGSL